jgi:transposase-like protein
MMDEGGYPTISALARAEGVTPAAVSRALIQLRCAMVREFDTMADHRSSGR